MRNVAYSTPFAQKRFDWRTFLASPALSALLIGATILELLVGHMNCDISWFIVFAEKVLDGAVPYVEISDPNPPAAFMIYMPAVLLERWSGSPAESFVVGEIAVALSASLAAVFALLRSVAPLDRPQWGQLRNCAIFFLFFTPSYCFGEREHFALIGALPLLAVYWLRSQNHPVPGAGAMGAGLAGALVLAFKPHFAVGFLFALLASAWLSKNYKNVFRLENFTLTGGFALALALMGAFYPEYFPYGFKPALEIYAPARQPLVAILTSTGFLVYFLLAMVFALLWGQASAGAIILAAASLGFMAIYCIQAKLWIYQAYPAIALICGACALIFIQRFSALALTSKTAILSRLLPVFLAPPFCFGLTTNLASAESFPGLTAAVLAAAPAPAKIAALQEDMTPAFPLLRRVGGRWIGRQNALWRTNCADHILSGSGVSQERRKTLEAARQTDLSEFVEDVRNGAPDILLIENAEARARYAADPRIAKILQDFRFSGVYSEVEVWVRN